MWPIQSNVITLLLIFYIITIIISNVFVGMKSFSSHYFEQKEAIITTFNVIYSLLSINVNPASKAPDVLTGIIVYEADALRPYLSRNRRVTGAGTQCSLKRGSIVILPSHIFQKCCYYHTPPPCIIVLSPYIYALTIKWSSSIFGYTPPSCNAF
jgi:hypothetical protein